MRVRVLVVALLAALPAALFGLAAPADASAPTVTIQAASHTSVAGSSVRFWGSTSNTGNGTLKITVAQAGGPTVTFGLQQPAEGPYEVRLELTVNSLVTATVEGGTTGTASAGWSMWVRPQIATALRSAHSSVGAYQVMRRGVSPEFRSGAAPKRPGDLCLRHQVQRFRDGGWHTRVTTACRVEDGRGRVSWTWAGSHPAGVRYRVRAAFPCDSTNLKGKGPWLYFRFQ